MAAPAENSRAASLQAGLYKSFPIYEFVGLEVESASDGVCRCFVPHRPSNMNHISTIHAAIQWAASEVLGGLVMMSALEGLPFFAVVKNVSIDFKRPARTDVTTETLFGADEAARFKADFEKNGEAEFSLHCVVRDEDGVEVAIAQGGYLARKPREG